MLANRSIQASHAHLTAIFNIKTDRSLLKGLDHPNFFFFCSIDLQEERLSGLSGVMHVARLFSIWLRVEGANP